MASRRRRLIRGWKRRGELDESYEPEGKKVGRPSFMGRLKTALAVRSEEIEAREEQAVAQAEVSLALQRERLARDIARKKRYHEAKTTTYEHEAARERELGGAIKSQRERLLEARGARVQRQLEKRLVREERIRPYTEAGEKVAGTIGAGVIGLGRVGVRGARALERATRPPPARPYRAPSRRPARRPVKRAPMDIDLGLDEALGTIDLDFPDIEL